MSSAKKNSSKPKEAKYRQITSHLRNLILKGNLKPGAQLPTALVMAEEWDTNYFTVQLALKPLVNEGLIERRRRHGTFVRDRSTEVASAAIYFGGNLWSAEHIFYQRVFQHLEQFYLERKGRSVLFVDHRGYRDKFTPLPALQKAIDQREVQGVIGLMLTSPEIGWLRKLGVPISLFGSAGLHNDGVELSETVLARFAADGCRSVGLIAPRSSREALAIFKNLAQRHGLKTHPDWMRNAGASDVSHDFSGYRLFRELWAQPTHPDGLFVYPDIACHGVVVAALELGLSIPRDLRLIFHRNTGTKYLCPWKIPYVVSDIKEMATLLASHLDAEYRHESAPVPTIISKLVDFPDASV